MPWGAAVGAGIGLLGDAMKEDRNGGAGTKNSSAEPWVFAQPFLLQNIAQGQALQNEYAARPFSARQQRAYENQYALSDYGRQLVPSLLGQMQGQPVGFDKKNPTARPKAWDWNSLASGMGQRTISDVVEPTPAKKEEAKEFRQQDMGYTPQQQALIDSGRSPWLLGETQFVQSGGINGGLGNGGYGSYVYGSTPQPGTQAYRDMAEYFLMGGNDPWNIAPGGMGIKRATGLGNQWAGTNNGSGIGSSAPTGNDY